MERNVGGRDRIVRGVLAVVLGAVALATVRRGRRTVALLAAAAALGLGFNATTCFCGLNEALGIDTTEDG